MNKLELQAKWSKYCDTDQLVNDMIALLREYGHDCSEHGVCTLLDKYFTNKEPLIRLFITSNRYIGNMRIACVKQFDRQISSNEISSFFCNIHGALSSEQILNYTDENNKTIDDYLVTGSKLFSISTLPSKAKQDERAKHLARFNYASGATAKSHLKYEMFVQYMRFFSSVCSSTLHTGFKSNIGGEKCPDLKPGTKTSRAFNTVCKFYGVDKFNAYTEQTVRDGQPVSRTVYPYEKVFAKYADLVSDLKRKMHFVISLNPLDYLTMSFGVNWISCHNISHGGWKGGCLSYMLDGTSMITYVVDNMDGPIHQIPKVYRQMYHYENNLFVQNRLYPQGNDGAINLYDKFRNFVTEEFTELLSVNGNWTCYVGKEYVVPHVNSVGAHYKDYNSSSTKCSIFYPSENEVCALGHVMTVGHSGICVRCGAEYTSGSSLRHSYRSDCVPFH